jgi:hypothetical protein
MKYLSWFKLYTPDDVTRAIREWVTPNFRLIEDKAAHELVILAPRKYHEKIKLCIHTRMSLSMAYAIMDLNLVGVILVRMKRMWRWVRRAKGNGQVEG